ncbi:MAG: hypothetical protein JSS87_13890 [Acidobacteria bacterium]|nr:hypothetical protein [Acidobacteriota bacterium]
MKNVTLSADEHLIEDVRLLAQRRRTTLNALFRAWLQEMSAQNKREDLNTVMKRLSYVKPGRKFTRDEMNAR